MRDLHRKRRDFLSTSRPFSDLIPWMLRIGDTGCILKDGSILSVYRFEGVDVESLENDALLVETARLEHAYRLAGVNGDYWWIVDRRCETGAMRPTVDWGNGVPGAGPEIGGRVYHNRHFLALLTRPQARRDHFWQRVGLETARGKSPGLALWEACKSQFSTQAAWPYSTLEVTELLTEHEKRMERFVGSLPGWGWQRLEANQLLAFLRNRLAPDECAELRIPASVYLDDALAERPLEVVGHQLHWPGRPGTWATLVTLKAWPRDHGAGEEPGTYPGMLDALLELDGSVTVSLAFRPIPAAAAEAWISRVRNHHRALEKSWRASLREVLTRKEVPADREQHVRASREAGQALEHLEEGQYGYLNLTVACYGSSPEASDAVAARIEAAVHAVGFMALTERMHALSAWAGTLPGQWAEPVRWFLVSGANAADLALARGLPEGSLANPHLTGADGKPLPALAWFGTRRMTPFHFHFHHGQNGHTLIVGPTRSGKSVFTNFLIARWMGFPDTQAFLFDKDRSAEILVALLDGNYCDLASGSATPAILNPLDQLADPEERGWLHSWLMALLESEGTRLGPDDAGHLQNALEALAALPATEWRLATLGQLLPKQSLVTALAPWMASGPFGWCFDKAGVGDAPARLEAFEVGRLFRQPRVARLVLDALFHRILLALDGRPTLISVEEAWFILSDPFFAGKIEEWIRTLAKKNALLLLVTQSVEELARVPAGKLLLENIPTRIFLPNPQIRGQEDLYARLFGLTPDQLRCIERARPGRDYYLTRPGFGRLFECPFSQVELAGLRSDALAQRLFHRARTVQAEGWRRTYLEKAIHG
jgi:type IV secretion system protein VirB4